ncbi:MAG: hypothetical protein ACFFFH_11325 [Candidatus Thorarchaeota archaeon]
MKTKLGDLRSRNELLIILDVVIPPSESQTMETVTFNVKWILQNGSIKPIQTTMTCNMTYTRKESLLATEDG